MRVQPGVATGGVRLRWRAVTAEGRVMSGVAEAADSQALADELRGRGWLMLEAEPAGSAGREGARRTLESRDLALLARQLATLIDARLTLDRALAIIAEKQPRPVPARLARDALERLKEGRSLADALDEQPTALPPFVIGMIRAGETGGGGGLAEVLARLADHLEAAERLKASVRSALVYPAILLVAVVLVLGLLLGVVLPQFRPLFASAGTALPWQARFVLDAGDAVADYWWAAPATLLVVALLIRLRRPDAAALCRRDALVLALPLIGPTIARIEAARFSRILGTMLANGMPLAQAMEASRDALSNRAFSAAIGEVADALRRGERMGPRIAAAGVMPDLAVQLIEVGEETGRLQPMLMRVASMLDEEVALRVARMTSLLVPALTIGLGLVVAMVIGAVMSAMMSVYELPT